VIHVTPREVVALMPDVRRLRLRFASTAPRAWDPLTASAEMAVQLGHLALCLLYRADGDASDLTDPKRPINNAGDELADVLLAALSVTVLAGTNPDPIPSPPPTWDRVESSDFLRLVAAAGQLAEAAMIASGSRHQPQGDPRSISASSAMVAVCCDELAAEIGIDLQSEFRRMVADAEAFLDARTGRR
jgi:hypothetical protein